MTLFNLNRSSLLKSGQSKMSHISATTARDKFPVAVSFKPGVLEAASRKPKVLFVIADN